MSHPPLTGKVALVTGGTRSIGAASLFIATQEASKHLREGGRIIHITTKPQTR